MKRKFLIIMLIVTMAIAVLESNLISSAADTIDIKTQMSDFTQPGLADESEVGDTAVRLGGAVVVIFQVATTGIAVIMLIVLAMKYMLAAPGDKADIKKHAVVYVVGAVILFSVSGILKIIEIFTDENVNDVHG